MSDDKYVQYVCDSVKNIHGLDARVVKSKPFTNVEVLKPGTDIKLSTIVIQDYLNEVEAVARLNDAILEACALAKKEPGSK